MVGAGFENFRVQVEIETVIGNQAGLAHGPQLHGIQKDAAIARRAHEDGHGVAETGGEQAGGHAVLLLLRGVVFAEQVAEFGAGHFALEFGAGQHGAEEAILIQQDAFVEGHVGDADGALVAQGGVVAEDGDLVNGAGLVGVQAAMAVVIADGVGSAEVGHPAGFEQRDEPRMVLSGNRDGAGDGQRQRATHADGAVQDLVDAAQIGPAEGRQAVDEEFVHGAAFVHAARLDVSARTATLMVLFVGHKLEHSRRGQVSECRAVGKQGTPSKTPLAHAPAESRRQPRLAAPQVLHAEEVGAHARHGAVLRPVQVDAHQDVLHGILGIFQTAQAAERKVHQFVLHRLHQGLELVHRLRPAARGVQRHGLRPGRRSL